MDDQLSESNEALRSKLNGRAGVRSGLSRSEQPKTSTTAPSGHSNKFKQVADDVKTRKHSNASGDAGGGSGGKQRGGSGDFYSHLSGGAKEMLEKTVND